MSEWKEYMLSDVMDIIGGGTPKTSIPEYWSGSIPWLSVVDFGNENKHVQKTEKYITELGLKSSSTKILRDGQIIISARGTVGELAVIKGNMAFNQSCYGLTAKESICHNDFLYYLLKCKIVELKRNAHGAVFDTITRTTFDSISAIVPDLPTQTAIAEILSSLDDKIEINNKINQELENLAQTLFKQWFIDFEFPNENGEPFKSSGGEMMDCELGEIPKGWEIGTLDSILTVSGGTTPSTKESSYWDGDIHWTSPRDLSNLKSPILLDTEKKITQLGLNKIGSGLLPKGTLLLSSRAPIGYLAITEIETAINQGYIGINGKGEFSNLFILCWLKSNMNSVIERANGSTFLEISKSNFRQIKIVIPSTDSLNNFTNQFELMFDQIRINTIEIKELINLRDTLLPKLISGELEINELPN
jgi:type I restriction enzyme S subunit